MEIAEITETILSLETMISERMRKNIHYRSMRNFVLHFEEISSEKAREKVHRLLEGYIEEVRAHDYDFERDSSYQLARKYLSPLSGYYKESSNFMGFIGIKLALFIGILGDVILRITHLSSAIWHLPIVTICFLLYYLFIVIFKEPKGRVYGFHY